MLVYTHVTRIGTGKDSDGKSTYRMVETADCSVPVTLDDVRQLLNDPNFTREVEVTLNESSKEHKRTVKMPFLCKLLVNSLGLAFNAKARQGEGINPLIVAAEAIKAGGEWAEEARKAMATGDRKALRAFAERYLESESGEE
jgi:hypothetical protein